MNNIGFIVYYHRTVIYCIISSHHILTLAAPIFSYLISVVLIIIHLVFSFTMNEQVE